jgi:hypothetical protein
MSSVVKKKREGLGEELHKIKIHTPDSGYESFLVSIINRSTREALTFDPHLGKPATIYYSLTKAGTIRLRIVRRDNPELVLLTLQDWTEQGFGRHEVRWDGRDASGNIINNKKVLITFDAKDQAFGGKHQEHDARRCYDPKLIIETTPELTRKIKGNLDIITSFAEGPDRIRWDPNCEVKYFIDYSLFKREVFKNIVNTTRFREDKFYLRLDTTKLSKGEHIITVNINDFNDHIGTASLKINVNDS